jgi:hypothetical protein
MLFSSTGLTNDLISMWITNSDSAEYIYTSLQIHFYKRPLPEDAKLKLYSYRVARNKDLAKIKGRIGTASGDCSQGCPCRS